MCCTTSGAEILASGYDIVAILKIGDAVKLVKRYSTLKQMYSGVIKDYGYE